MRKKDVGRIVLLKIYTSTAYGVQKMTFFCLSYSQVQKFLGEKGTFVDKLQNGTYKMGISCHPKSHKANDLTENSHLAELKTDVTGERRTEQNENIHKSIQKLFRRCKYKL